MEAAGEEELVLTVLTYNGTRSIWRPPENQGWPGLGVMQKGAPMVVLLPDTRLGFWESHADVDVEYSPEAVASALVTENTLDDQVFGSGYDPDLRDRVFEHLGLDPAYDADGYREQLIDIAGVDESDATDEMDPEAARREELMGSTRNTLLAVAGTDEIDHGLGSLNSATKSDLAEALTAFDDEKVDALIEDAERGDL